MDPLASSLIDILKDEIKLLEAWAEESMSGGWSTHQVKAQQNRANYLKQILYDILT